jgi:hypothetical protein
MRIETTHESRRHAGKQAVRGDILGNDRAGADDGAATHPNSRHNRYSRTYPGPIADLDGSPLETTTPLLGPTDLVGSGEKLDVIADVNTVSDSNLCTQIDMQLAANERSGPDRK